MSQNERYGGNRSGPLDGRGPGGFGGAGGFGMPVQKAKNAKGAFFRLLGYFRPQALWLIVVAVAAVASTIFSIISPKVLGNITTDIFQGYIQSLRGVPGGGVNFPQIVQALAYLAALYVFSAIFSYIQQYIMAGVAQRTIYALRRQVMDKLGRLPIKYFDTHPHGDVLSRFVNDFDNISSTLQQSLTQAVTAIITFIGVIVMMLTISPLMTLVIVLTLPLSFVATRVIAKRSQTYFGQRQKRLGELNGHVEEMYTGHSIVKAFGRERQSVEAFNSINERLYESSWKAQFVTGIIMPLMNVIGNLGYVLVSVIGGILVARGSLPIGDIQAFIQYARQFTQPITQLASISNVIQSTLASAERVFEILDEPEEIQDAESLDELHRVSGSVRFDGVDFQYQAGEPLITSMNIDVKAGEMVAIVGPTGAGKTTLVNLLMRFYDVDAGAITVDGVDLRQVPRSSLRHSFGMVLQDTWLFHGTIRDNIGYGGQDVSEDKIIAAAKAARADHFIRTLPDGYDTVLNEEASNISLGQRQLLTIARAILADPAIMILDEATSSVDTRTEVLIQDAMHHLMQGRTSFVIAHRLSTIRNADLILVMNHGRVIEQGTHQALLAQNGFYRDLYMSQFEKAKEPRVASWSG